MGKNWFVELLKGTKCKTNHPCYCFTHRFRNKPMYGSMDVHGLVSAPFFGDVFFWCVLVCMGRTNHWWPARADWSTAGMVLHL